MLSIGAFLFTSVICLQHFDSCPFAQLLISLVSLGLIRSALSPISPQTRQRHLQVLHLASRWFEWQSCLRQYFNSCLFVVNTFCSTTCNLLTAIFSNPQNNINITNVWRSQCAMVKVKAVKLSHFPHWIDLVAVSSASLGVQCSVYCVSVLLWLARHWSADNQSQQQLLYSVAFQ